MTTLYLASGSPRRRELLAQVGVAFTALNVPIDETPVPDEAAPAYVERLARAKAAAGVAALQGPGVVLGADTAVVLDGQILGKPESPEHARSMLLSLSGRSHEVMTAVAVTDGQRTRSLCVTSQVRFAELSAVQVQRYWASGEPLDKAGGYAIQGLGAVFVTGLAGSYSAVVGLPLHETVELLGEFGVECWQSLPASAEDRR